MLVQQNTPAGAVEVTKIPTQSQSLQIVAAVALKSLPVPHNIGVELQQPASAMMFQTDIQTKFQTAPQSVLHTASQLDFRTAPQITL